jgi:RNA polymerase sigma factor (sigma-70 family)
MSHPDPDIELVLALQNGSESSLDELIKRHKEPLYRFVYRYVLNEQDARDIVQESFVRVYFGIQKFKPGAKFITWLYQIAINLCLDHKKSKQAKQSKLTEALPDYSSHKWKASTANPSEEIVSKEVLEVLEQAISELPHELKVALIMVALENRSQKECAEVLGTNPKAIENRVYRARKILEQKLKTFYDEKSSFSR